MVNQWGAAAVFGGPVPANLLMRMTEVCQIYDRFARYASIMRSGSPMVKLMELKKDGKITDDDFMFIEPLLDSGELARAWGS